MLIKCSFIFRYVFVWVLVPLAFVYVANQPVGTDRGFDLSLQVLYLATIVMAVITAVNILKVLFDNYILSKTAALLPEPQRRQMNSVRRQENLAIVLFVFACVFFSWICVKLDGSESWYVPFLFAGASPLPCCSFIDFLFFAEQKKKFIFETLS